MSERIRVTSLSVHERRLAFDTRAFIGGKLAVMALVEVAAGKDTVLAVQAKRWLFNRRQDRWKNIVTPEPLKERRVYDPGTIVLQPVMMPDVPVSSILLAPVELARLKGEAVRGKSRMFSAKPLGFTAQNLANLAAYSQSYIAASK